LNEDTGDSCVALAYVPRALRAALFPLAAGGASADELIDAARERDPEHKWLPDGRALEKDALRMDQSGTRALTPAHADYPVTLREIHDPPLCLYVRGRLPEANAKAVAIVGARASVGNSLAFATELARSLGAAGIPVVSGMARGIDGAAHSGCLDGGAKTVAVLGCGVDVCYPRDNRALMERILDEGAILSEYAMGTAPAPYHFPARNRIISGMSEGTVVVEARPGSGALITAKFACEQGRIVFAVPGAVWNPLGDGPNGLIRDGAVLVRNADDVIEEIFGIAPRCGGREAKGPLGLEKAERGLLASLDYDVPRHVDRAAADAGMSAAEALTLLTKLELRGFAADLGGKRFVRLRGGS
jgi:DNA processing protein